MTDPIHQNESESGAGVEEQIREPRKYKVLLHNDDYTTMEFVVEILMTVFHKSEAEATQIMLAVHKNGMGVCGVYTAEVAETKVVAVRQLARRGGYPLKCTMEEE
ncbi:MAG: ATP-dependent Clp protease adapter ClpS [Thermodesulfobacteriota bacterium]